MGPLVGAVLAGWMAAVGGLTNVCDASLKMKRSGAERVFLLLLRTIPGSAPSWGQSGDDEGRYSVASPFLNTLQPLCLKHHAKTRPSRLTNTTLEGPRLRRRRPLIYHDMDFRMFRNRILVLPCPEPDVIIPPSFCPVRLCPCQEIGKHDENPRIGI